jgi:glutamate synthase (ferredoxin)
MSAGVAYVLDEDGQFPSKVNRDMVGLERLQVGSPGEATLHKLIRAHAGATGSERATDILRQWSRFQPQFWIVVPRPPQIDTTILPTRVAARVVAAAVPTAVSIP